jgi:hypothetical protein
MTNDVIDILRKQMKMANESNENNNGYKVMQLTTSALIDAYHNESSLNASEEEELAWARISNLFNTKIQPTEILPYFSYLVVMRIGW